MIVLGIPIYQTTYKRKRGMSSLTVIVSLIGIVIGYLLSQSTKITTILYLFLLSEYFLKLTDICYHG